MLPPPRWWLLVLRLLVAIASVYFGVYHRWRREGREHVPAHGPLIITVNHLSVMDVLAMGAALTLQGLEPGVDFFTASKQELYQNPLLAKVLSLLGMFALERGRVDLQAMRLVVSILKEGKMLALAPEGTRSPTGHLQLFQPVVAKIAITRRAPILPIGLSGMDRAMPIGAKIPRPAQLTIRCGAVYDLSAYYDQTLTPPVLERAAWEMRARVAELLPEWMRELPPAEAAARFGSVRAAESAAPDSRPSVEP